MKNKWAGHPTFDYATFKAYALNVFGHKCICELLQDGEIWSEDEYWGSKLYDFDDNKYYYCGWYIQTPKEWEELLTKWKKDKEDPSEGLISEDYNEYDQDALDFYKDYLNSGSKLDLNIYYEKNYNR